MTEKKVLIDFIGGGMVLPLTIAAKPGQRLIEPVRELVRDGELPLHWRCGQGTCGACVVYLTHAESGAEYPLSMNGRERNVLRRLGLLDDAQANATSLPDTPALPRLACDVLLQVGRLQVVW